MSFKNEKYPMLRMKTNSGEVLKPEGCLLSRNPTLL